MPPLQFHPPSLHWPLPTCSSTTACQQRVRFFRMLLGSPGVARELQAWLLFLPSGETEGGAEARSGQPLSSSVLFQG